MHLDIVFKAFVGMLASVVIIGSGLSVTRGFSQAVAADNYLESVTKVILESNYNANVIEKCKQEALGNGYVLNVQVEDARKAGVKSYAKIDLCYYFEMKLFGIKQEKQRTKII